jgi:diguanylate cyclase (GGDEF)-like protein
MTLTQSLQNLEAALAQVLNAARLDDKTPLQNGLSLNESKATFASSNDSYDVIAFADINRFKKINTEHGYAAGDAAINKIGTLMHERFVKGLEAQAFRQSGDEFVILFHQKHLENFINATASFESCPIEFGEKSFIAPVSFGYAISDGQNDFETVKSRAEVACKIAKSQGDGTCVGWTPKMEHDSFESLRDNCPDCLSVTSCEVPASLNINKVQFCGACGKFLG